MSRHLNLFLIGFFLLTSCGKDDGSRFEVRLDRVVEEAVLEYWKENKIDQTQKVITTEWIVNPGAKTEVYITNLNSDVYKEEGYAPSYYAILDSGLVVFVYTNVEKLIVRKDESILDEISVVLLENNVKLKSFENLQYSAPTWLYTSCSAGKTNSLARRIDPLEYSYVPCGYVLRQKESRSDSLYLVKPIQSSGVEIRE